MDNIISLHKKNKEDFKTTLDTPLNLGLSDTKETEPTIKTPAFIKEYAGSVLKIQG